MSKTHNLLCIVCPEGCEIEATETNGEFKFLPGICKRGQEYAAQEIVNPCRYLTTTVQLTGAEQNMLPVRTFEAIPKEKLIQAMNQIVDVTVTAPVNIGDIICSDMANTGIALIASKSCQKSLL